MSLGGAHAGPRWGHQSAGVDAVKQQPEWHELETSRQPVRPVEHDAAENSVELINIASVDYGAELIHASSEQLASQHDRNFASAACVLADNNNQEWISVGSLPQSLTLCFNPNFGRVQTFGWICKQLKGAPREVSLWTSINGVHFNAKRVLRCHRSHAKMALFSLSDMDIGKEGTWRLVFSEVFDADCVHVSRVLLFREPIHQVVESLGCWQPVTNSPKHTTAVTSPTSSVDVPISQSVTTSSVWAASATGNEDYVQDQTIDVCDLHENTGEQDGTNFRANSPCTPIKQHNPKTMPIPRSALVPPRVERNANTVPSFCGVPNNIDEEEDMVEQNCVASPETRTERATINANQSEQLPISRKPIDLSSSQGHRVITKITDTSDRNNPAHAIPEWRADLLAMSSSFESQITALRSEVFSCIDKSSSRGRVKKPTSIDADSLPESAHVGRVAPVTSTEMLLAKLRAKIEERTRKQERLNSLLANTRRRKQTNH